MIKWNVTVWVVCIVLLVVWGVVLYRQSKILRISDRDSDIVRAVWRWVVLEKDSGSPDFYSNSITNMGILQGFTENRDVIRLLDVAKSYACYAMNNPKDVDILNRRWENFLDELYSVSDTYGVDTY